MANLMCHVFSLFFLIVPFFIDGQTNFQLHEAFLQRTSNLVPLETIPTHPPKLISETIPPQTAKDTKWLPGYWSWNTNRKKYEWICGIWRRPPPVQEWTEGKWTSTSSGWVYVKGFWSAASQKREINYLPAPPDPLQENPGPPPSSNFFWAPGCWVYSTSNEFIWLSGSWLPLSRDWILVPSQYIWQPKGYVFVPPYWDWPVNKIGTAYSCTEPVAILDTEIILRRSLVSYPDYACYYLHHQHFYPNFWKACSCSPPWWDWSEWWGLNWQNQWSLWWWYGNPGYPSPFWMTDELSQKIAPPSQKILEMFKNAKEPIFITSRGIPTLEEWFQAIEGVSGKRNLAIPQALKKNVVSHVEAFLPKMKTALKPTGKLGIKHLPVPFFTPIKNPAGRYTFPNPPANPEKTPDQTIQKVVPEFRPLGSEIEDFKPVYPQTEE